MLKIPKKCTALAEQLPEGSVKKAIASALEYRIIQIYKDPEIYVFKGTREDYLLLPPYYCSCMDFQINVIARRLRVGCYHILASCISKVYGRVKEFILNDIDTTTTVINEILTHGRSNTIRQLVSEGDNVGEEEEEEKNYQKNH